MKETHTITTTHDIPADIRNALKIREDLDGISGELLGYKKAAYMASRTSEFYGGLCLFFWASVGTWWMLGGGFGGDPGLIELAFSTLLVAPFPLC